MNDPETNDPEDEAELRRYYEVDRELVRRAAQRALWGERAAIPLRRPQRTLLAGTAAAMLVALAWLGWAFHQARQPHDLWERGGTTVGRLRQGEWLETVGADATRLALGGIGEVQLEPGSRLRLAAIAADRHELYLEQGALQAFIFAPARVFQVGTPAGLAVDLGCVYRLRVGPDGTTYLEVTAGRVSFELAGMKSLVPAGASCRAWPDRGLSAPLWDDAPRELRPLAELALDELRQAETWRAALEAARPKDSLSLWHLLQTPDGDLRRAVQKRLSAFIETPPADDAPDARWRELLEPLWEAEGR